MAPELLLGEAPQPRTDLYAMGMVLQECITGVTPFRKDTPRGFLARKLERDDTTARGPTPVPHAPTLQAIADLLTSPDPEDRPATAAAVLVLLSRIG